MPHRITNPLPTLLVLLPLLKLLSRSSAAAVGTNPYYNSCSSSLRNCGSSHINVSYPFRFSGSPEYCGFPGYEIYCNHDKSMLTINLSGDKYIVQQIDYDQGFLNVVDSNFLGNFLGDSCPQTFRNTSFNTSLFTFADADINITVYANCAAPLPPSSGFGEITCLSDGSSNPLYFKLGKGPEPFLLELLEGCHSMAEVPVLEAASSSLNISSPGNFNAVLQKGFGMKWIAENGWCKGCIDAGGVCGYNSTRANDPICFCPSNTYPGSCPYGKKESSKAGLIIGLSIVGIFCFILLCSICFLIYRRRKKRPSALLNRTTSSAMSSKTDAEFGSSLYTPIFSYDELYEATNGFDSTKELGDGGFGTVYKGKLKDGRVVAVKRLYETNYRRLEQFINEVKIVSLLRHHNLASLYGCTSRHSRELLLVYEFVPNGTIAEHLHGSRASNSAFLPWSVRMSIAIETADALNYLHSIEPQIIHRDIKTSNILLDNSFHVKLADFGLSRLFPLDATHVSTAPQGTPGYVDPEYHKIFQLTDKSDVYSFGVVLMELISSMPAVDINRDRNEINLAYMAINKIQRQELHELVDPRLGFQSDSRINRMITQVAGLAFRCLQLEREMRPAIKEVLQTLRGLASDGRADEVSMQVEKEEARLLKCILPCSPDSVADRWVSSSSMSSFSG